MSPVSSLCHARAMREKDIQIAVLNRKLEECYAEIDFLTTRNADLLDQLADDAEVRPLRLIQGRFRRVDTPGGDAA